MRNEQFGFPLHENALRSLAQRVKRAASRP
jgi:hypothetical protein